MPNVPLPKRLVGSDLITLAAKMPMQFTQICEQRYCQCIETAAEQILSQERPVVMLTGPSSSGKTTTAHRLAAAIASKGRRSEVISLDDFFVGDGRYPKRADGTDDYECVEALDVPAIKNCLKAIAEGAACRVPRFDFLRQQPSGEYHTVQGGAVVIIEGLHAFNPALTRELPTGKVFRIYVGLREEYCDAFGQRILCTRDVRLARRMIRDRNFRGHGPDFTLDLWSHVCEAEERYIKVYKDTTDLFLDSSFSYEICLWRKLLPPMAADLKKRPGNIQRMELLCRAFAPFPEMGAETVPADSMLREFIGKI